MGRTSLFSFPVPGRMRDGVDIQSVPEIYKHRDDRAKAEHFLGLGHMPKPNTTNKKNGSMNVAVSEVGFNRTPEVNDALGKKSTRPKLHAKPLSDMLGEGHGQAVEMSLPSGASRSALNQASSSTLRSPYAPQRAPLSVSQQTSLSSPRDIPPRKGVSTSNMATTAPIIQRQGPSGQVTTENIHTNSQAQSKRPPRLDMSRLFPRTKGNGENLLSPSQLGLSPSPLTSRSEHLPSPNSASGKGGRRGLRNKKSKESVKTTISQSTVSRSTRSEKYDSPKLNVKRPPRGVQHWFDAVDVDEDDDEEEDCDESADLNLSQSFDPSQRAARKASGVVHSSDHGSHRQTITKAKMGIGTDRFGILDTAHQPSTASAVGSQTGRLKKPTERAMSNTNLQSQSVLSLSSDEEETDNHHFNPKPYAQDVNVPIRNASKDASLPVRHPRQMQAPPKKETDSLRHSGLTSGSIPIALPTNHHYHHNWSRNNSQRSHQSQSTSTRNEGHPTHTSSNSSEPFGSRSETPTQPTSPTTTFTTVSTEPGRDDESSRMMVVTKEEEALLAMMRRKRAAMAKNSFSEGYRQALAEEQALLEEEAANKKRQALHTMQARQHERNSAPRSRGQSHASQTSTKFTETPITTIFPTIPELMDTSYPHVEKQNCTKEHPPSYLSTYSSSTPQIRSRSGSQATSHTTGALSSASVSEQPKPHSDVQSISDAPLGSIPIASPYLHLFPSPGGTTTSLLDQNPIDRILAFSDRSPAASTTPSQTTADTLDSPITPDQAEQLPFSSPATSSTTTLPRRRGTNDTIIRTQQQQQASEKPLAAMFSSSSNSSRSSILPIFPQSPSMRSLVSEPPTKGDLRGGEVGAARMQSMQSMNSVQSYHSVGADVLAAWGALGGWSQEERVKLGAEVRRR